MYDKPYDRKFGIEFEFNLPGLIPEYPNRVDNGQRYPSKYYTLENLLRDNNLVGFAVHHDGSEFEVKTPILSGPNGFKTVRRFLEMVNDMGADVSLAADGLHVHHDAPEFIGQDDLTIQLVQNWYENQEEIMKLVHKCRYGRGSNPLWNPEDVERLTNNRDMYGYGRKALNISALYRHGTIEFRAHEGTLDYNEVFSWVRFGQAFIGKVANNPETRIEKANDPLDLLKKVRVSRNATRFLARKYANRDENYRSVSVW